MTARLARSWSLKAGARLPSHGRGDGGGVRGHEGRFYMSADATVGTKGDKIYEARIIKASSQNNTMRSPITPSRLLYLSVIESPTTNLWRC
jgi:hypothetical protein